MSVLCFERFGARFTNISTLFCHGADLYPSLLRPEMLTYSDRSHRVQQRLEQMTVGALYVYAGCAVVSISAMQAAYIFALVTWMARLYLQGHPLQLRLPLLLPFSG